VDQPTAHFKTSYAEVDATMAILKALKISGGGKLTKKVLAIGTTNTFKGVLLTDGIRVSMLDSSLLPFLMN